jgi:hypothetical protein
MSEVLYLYGFLPAGASAPGPELTGLEDRPVEVIGLDGFAAAVSRLPADGYDEPALEERVGDLRWMAHRGFLHERVVTWFVDRGGIVPVRFLTLHVSPEALRGEAERRGARILELLERFDGRREWNLKVTLDRDALLARIGEESDAIRELDREITGASPGRRYLLERRRNAAARERVDEVAERLASGFLEALGEHAEEVKRLPLRRVEGRERVVAHAALLVAVDEEPGLQAEADRRAEALSERGLEAELSGPWAPYRFVDVDGSEGPDRAVASPPRGAADGGGSA